MEHEELQEKRAETWRTLFDENHSDLTIAAEMLLRCDSSPETIINKALAALEDSPYEDDSHDHAIRAVVEAAIAHNRHTSNSLIKAEAPGPVKRGFPGSSQIGMLPWPERAVYFLHGVLHYSGHDTALLLGMSVAQIDQLYRYAAKRIVY